MDRTPKKPCKHCGLTGHFSYSCYQNPKRALKALKRTPLRRSTKPINRIGKTTKQWFITRATWIRHNPPTIDGQYWECYLRIHPWCSRLLTTNKDLLRPGVGMLTLDHVVSRSHDSSLRFNMSNLRPACKWCNNEKGSRSLDVVTTSRVE